MSSIQRKRTPEWVLTTREFAGAIHRYSAEHGCSQQTIADLLDVPLGTLSNYITGVSPVPVDVYVRACTVLEDARPMQQLCRLVGGRYEANTADAPSVVHAVSSAQRECAESHGAALDAIEDGDVNESELDRYLRENDQAREALDRERAAMIASVGRGRVVPIADRRAASMREAITREGR
jgi:hypothetical protein